MRTLRLLLLSATVVSLHYNAVRDVNASEIYMNYLPNNLLFNSQKLYAGSNCPSSQRTSGCLCGAIGHTSCLSATKGNINTFGRDYQRQGRWTTTLCNTDSDGDGLTNGEELGDPLCTWAVGGTPYRTTELSNPGDAASTNNATRAANLGGTAAVITSTSSAGTTGASTTAAGTAAGLSLLPTGMSNTHVEGLFYMLTSLLLLLLSVLWLHNDG